MVIDFIKRYRWHVHSFHLFQLPDIVDLEVGVLSVMVNDNYLWIIPYSQHCFLWNLVFYSGKAYLAHQYKKMLYHLWSYRITIDETPIPLKRICVLNYLCLLLSNLLSRGIISTTERRGIERIPKIKRKKAMHFLKYLFSFLLEYFMITSIQYLELFEHEIQINI